VKINGHEKAHRKGGGKKGVSDRLRQDHQEDSKRKKGTKGGRAGLICFATGKKNAGTRRMKEQISPAKKKKKANA